jgi:cytochrome c-type protein NapC
MIRKAWDKLQGRCRLCARTTLIAGTALLVLLVSGVLMAGGAAGLAWTNTEKFCIGCHEMRDNVYAEYKGTIHDTNRTGVRAVCSDCHVPREPYPMLKRKVAATFELWGHLIGKIDTKEKFEKHRLELAQNVWRTMKNNDSHECRNCHNLASMDFSKQKQWSAPLHQNATKQGQTCIDCHKGIAHKLPAM